MLLLAHGAWFVVVICAAIEDPPVGPTNGADFLAFMESRTGAVRDLEFTFEGRVEPQHASMKGTRLRLTGQYSYVQNEGHKLDFDTEQGDGVSHHIATATKGNARTTRTTQGGGASGHVSRRQTAELNAPGLPGRMFFLNSFVEYGSQILETYENEGVEDIEGRRLLRVSFEQIPGLPQHRELRHTFWLDIERDWTPIRWTLTRGGRVELRSRVLEIQQFSDGAGASVWVPTSGQATSHLYRKNPPPPGEKQDPSTTLAYSADPVVIEKILVHPHSVKLNKNLGGDRLKVEFEKGEFVRDDIAGATYRVGQQQTRLTGLTAAEAEALLNTGIDDAETQVDGLRAGSRSRNLLSSPWLLGGTVATLSLGVLAILWHRRRF